MFDSTAIRVSGSKSERVGNCPTERRQRQIPQGRSTRMDPEALLVRQYCTKCSRSGGCGTISQLACSPASQRPGAVVLRVSTISILLSLACPVAAEIMEVSSVGDLTTTLTRLKP